MWSWDHWGLHNLMRCVTELSIKSDHKTYFAERVEKLRRPKQFYRDVLAEFCFTIQTQLINHRVPLTHTMRRWIYRLREYGERRRSLRSNLWMGAMRSYRWDYRQDWSWSIRSGSMQSSMIRKEHDQTESDFCCWWFSKSFRCELWWGICPCDNDGRITAYNCLIRKVGFKNLRLWTLSWTNVLSRL